MDYDEWLAKKTAEIEAEESRKKAEAAENENSETDDEDLPDF